MIIRWIKDIWGERSLTFLMRRRICFDSPADQREQRGRKMQQAALSKLNVKLARFPIHFSVMFFFSFPLVSFLPMLSRLLGQIQWFWRALRSFDHAQRAKFLQFVTGTSKVPLQVSLTNLWEGGEGYCTSRDQPIYLWILNSYH